MRRLSRLQQQKTRTFLLNRNRLKQTMNYTVCSSQMDLLPCAAFKLANLHIWKCQNCKKYSNKRAESVLAGKKLSIKTFLTLIWSLQNVEVSALVGLSAKAVGEWRTMLSNSLADWFILNSSSLSGPWETIEIDEAKFHPGYLCEHRPKRVYKL